MMGDKNFYEGSSWSYTKKNVSELHK
jgi:hypothetical protein